MSLFSFVESYCVKMMGRFYVYVLYSPGRDRYYVGYSGQLSDRFHRHQLGYSKSTKSGRPWLIVYLESFPSASAAYQRETAIKRRKSRRYLEELAASYLATPYPLPD